MIGQPAIRWFLLMTLVLAGGCAGTGRPAAPPRPARINHLAFFKLKNPAAAPQLIADCDRHLATIPGVVSYYAGEHLDTGRGARVDANYDVGFYVGFETEAAYAAYLDHPSHKAMVATWSPRWEWIRVHDVLDGTP